MLIVLIACAFYLMSGITTGKISLIIIFFSLPLAVVGLLDDRIDLSAIVRYLVQLLPQHFFWL